MRDSINRALFQVRWLFMGPQRRYAYLWNRTRESMRY
jgi:hypothetical protein